MCGNKSGLNTVIETETLASLLGMHSNPIKRDKPVLRLIPLACTLRLNFNSVSPPNGHGLTMRNKKVNTFVLKICSSEECAV